MIIKECLNCFKKFKVKPSKNDLLCCSKKCSLIYRRNHFKNKPELLDNKLICHHCNRYKPIDEFYQTFADSKKSARFNRMKNCIICHSKIGLENKRKRVQSIEGSLKELLRRTKAFCKLKNIFFDLDIEFLIQLFNSQNGKCALSGMPLESSNNNYNYYAVSIDRIISGKSYSKDNVRLVCWVVNQMRNDMEVEELVKWCSFISNFNKNI